MKKPYSNTKKNKFCRPNQIYPDTEVTHTEELALDQGRVWTNIKSFIQFGQTKFRLGCPNWFWAPVAENTLLRRVERFSDKPKSRKHKRMMFKIFLLKWIVPICFINYQKKILSVLSWSVISLCGLQ